MAEKRARRRDFATCHPTSVICHLSSAICHLPFAICHSPSAIRHLPFVGPVDRPICWRFTGPWTPGFLLREES